MEMKLFLEVLLRRIKNLLEDLELVNEDWFKFLPYEFDLMALATGYEEKPLPISELKQMLEPLVKSGDYRQITKAFHAVAAALKLYEVEVEWEESEEEASEEGAEPKADEKPEMTPKMDYLAEAFQAASPGSGKENLKEAMVRSFKECEGPTAWLKAMEEALSKRKGRKKFKPTMPDFYNFKKHPSIAEMIPSESGM